MFVPSAYTCQPSFNPVTTADEYTSFDASCYVTLLYNVFIFNASLRGVERTTSLLHSFFFCSLQFSA
jgi:hypothetical protein